MDHSDSDSKVIHESNPFAYLYSPPDCAHPQLRFSDPEHVQINKDLIEARDAYEAHLALLYPEQPQHPDPVPVQDETGHEESASLNIMREAYSQQSYLAKLIEIEAEAIRVVHDIVWGDEEIKVALTVTLETNGDDIYDYSHLSNHSAAIETETDEAEDLSVSHPDIIAYNNKMDTLETVVETGDETYPAALPHEDFSCPLKLLHSEVHEPEADDAVIPTPPHRVSDLYRSGSSRKRKRTPAANKAERSISTPEGKEVAAAVFSSPLSELPKNSRTRTKRARKAPVKFLLS